MTKSITEPAADAEAGEDWTARLAARRERELWGGGAWAERVEKYREAIGAGFNAALDLDASDCEYARPVAELAAEVAREYLSADRLPTLRKVAERNPVVVARGLFGRINDAIAAQNMLIKDEVLAGHKRQPLAALGLPEVAALVLALHDVVVLRDPDGTSSSELLAFYDPATGLYDVDEEHLRQVARGYRGDLSDKAWPDVRACLRDWAPRRDRVAHPDLIAVANGILDYRTGELSPFSPEHIFTSKTATPFNPDAQNPVIHNDDDGTDWDVESWMESLSDDPEVVDLLWKAIGAVIRPNVAWDKSLWFFSERGNNGKGTLLSLMRNVLGAGNWIDLPLATAGERFGLSELLSAGLPQAILTDENPVGSFVDNAAGIKSIITGDAVRVERKNRDGVTIRYRGVMVQCLNDSPRVKDRSPSFLRRLCLVSFEKCFTGAERKYIKNDYLRRPEVLEYVLKRVLDHALTPAHYELPEPDAVKCALAEFRESNDPVLEWWNDNKLIFQWDLLPFTFLHEFYVAWMGRRYANGKPLGYKAFCRELRQLVAADPTSQWYCDDHTAPIRPAQRMVDPEPLIVEYSLVNWGDTSTKPGDKNYRTRRATIPGDMFKANYRGLLRRDDPDAVSTEFTDPFADAGDRSGTAEVSSAGASDPVDPPVDQASMGPAVVGGLVATGERPTPAPAKSTRVRRSSTRSAIPKLDPDLFKPDYQFINNPYAPDAGDPA
ncbi:DNA primase [Gordonia amarae]|uniref:SF3 helicase domain-containing protein n=3 Tax=Gordonia amarae TaxID=36821 RepID=G7GN52_9ACTN|nr:phage/plasmid primase, P4 family [Gordonia amarae]MCS3877251.1 putative DNA primase/helicase [Gordonia amarae]QHN19648.1 DNA primase [Gordonia amarae]QHN24112.1 DNA primase [Gordonia amarae]QHN29417.1 DNA primase [Gordonia amarae]QHN41754.1 DNA primase [Gordonia amarae]